MTDFQNFVNSNFVFKERKFKLSVTNKFDKIRQQNFDRHV